MGNPNPSYGYEQTTVTPPNTNPMDFIPDQAWMILAVAIAGFIVLVGLRIYKSKRFKIDTKHIDIECKDNTSITERTERTEKH